MVAIIKRPSVTAADLARMRGRLFFDGDEATRKLSGFWVLLVLAAVIASAGVVSDSVATVIGAMIVAPLMTPILGTVLSVVTGDLVNLARSLGLVIAGAVTVVGISWLFGKIVAGPIVADTNSQVAGRVHPQLIDLIAALATGAVGSFALVRSDISETVPGVAIAISLVPPLAVVGLTLESGAGRQSLGALLLFLTNVGAILLSGLGVMVLYRGFAVSGRKSGRKGWRVRRRFAVGVVVTFVLLLATPLAVATYGVIQDTRERAELEPVASRWAQEADWHVVSVTSDDQGTKVIVTGEPPAPDLQALRQALAETGHADLHVTVVFVPSQRVEIGP
jgi:uncharacterized hydrophobic protein (TIGR00271 family)